ncbi:zinc-binding alcohol dehydrogenase [Microbacterium sp. zg.Y1090]|uniref:zinc-dependent alcohol dehydrogenase n=1 Tax=Microbacterium TaxID=33882 RepID=UPI00214B4287|nr:MULTISPECIES: zinc-binding alcohol dehydrogenase [unclassified Microbacterium]MCR2812865.1 zinc-binding alcohol dehydrogenase [Microbacterium sp. zg.Y1084]MCR2817332.1 zinc-binding alcohol dehydrogenase [Microbacterium sp. zg.Y1090]WIM29180.1 zinc-binding alcohol dehydrogenase [Microbacterium sp. zg-Y1090]
MPQIVQFTAPGLVELVETDAMPLGPGDVRVQTLYSGISAGTELTAYRGTNPYLTSTWDARRRLFVPGEPSFRYPVQGWGYSEVGRVCEVAPDVTSLREGDVVHGIWGHRSDAVLPASVLDGRVMPTDADPILGTFARVAAIALNAVLAADVRLGEQVAIFGQGVIGLLATRLAVLSGARVLAVDTLPERLAVARDFGADVTVDATGRGGAGAAVRVASDGGVDSAIELSGSDRALHEAVRSVVPDGLVAAAGFYQGGAPELRLGEEFHHNRVRIVASQISGVPAGLVGRWSPARLVQTVMRLICAGTIDAGVLVTDVVDAEDVAATFRRLDSGDRGMLQAVLRFGQAGRR